MGLGNNAWMGGIYWVINRRAKRTKVWKGLYF